MKHKISLMLLSSSLAINSVLPVYAIDINNPNDITNTEDESLAVLRDSESSNDEISIITDMSNQELSSISTIMLNSYNEMYTGSQITPQVIVIPHTSDAIFQENVDYTVTYGENIEGTGSIVVTGMGSYTGSTSIEFNISSGFGGVSTISTYGIMEITDETQEEITPQVQAIDISSVATNVQIDYTNNYTYTEGAILPTLTGLEGLTLDTDYYILYQNNINAGIDTGSVIIAGKGDYNGAILKTFTINPADISTKTTITDVDSSHEYTGSTITPIPTVSFTGFSNPTYDVSYGINTESGNSAGSVTITGNGNFTGSYTTNFNIATKAISDSDITKINDSYDYTGSSIEPVPTIVVDGRTLIKDTDYSVTYDNNTTVEDGGKVIIAGINNYTGDFEKSFSITATDLRTAVVNGIEDSYVYTGDEIKPSQISVVLNNKILELDTDYTISYDANTAIGDNTAKVTISGTGNYSGSIDKTFSIVKADLSTADVNGIEASYVYKAAVYEPVPTSVTLNGKTLVSGTDYEVSHGTNTDVSTGGTVIITGKGNYDGSSTSVSFTITPKDISSEATIGIIDDSHTYTGSQIIPVNVNVSGVDGAYYDISYGTNIDVSTGGTVIITGKDNYTGSKSENFTITAKSLSGAEINGIASSHTYTGNPITPTPTSVVLDGISLFNNVDYTISYETNTAIGDETAKIIITGKGNYDTNSNVEKAFSIAGKDITTFAISNILDQEYDDGNDVEPTGITINGLADTEYTISYRNNVDVGTAFAVATGINTYSGTIEKSFEIKEKNISDSIITIASQSYTGSQIKPSIIVESGGVTLTENKDYTIASYGDNINVSTGGTVNIAGINNYTDNFEESFSITATDLSTAVVNGIEASYVYTGDEIKPSQISVVLNNKILELDTDYTISYDTNTDIADGGKVTISGTGNYSGSIDKTFSIVKADLSTADVNGIEASYVYTGDAYKPVPTSVTLNGKTLTSGTDYEVSHGTNTDVSTGGTVIITGKGNYDGSSTSVSFTITPKSIDTVTGLALTIVDEEYTGLSITPSDVTVSSTGDVLTSSDYDMSYSNNTDVSTTAIATITGKGNYTGSKNENFTITAKSLSGANIVITPEQSVYSGSAIEPSIKVTLGNKVLTLTDDYTISYKDNSDNATNVDVGTATVTITGDNNYKDTATGTFEIVAMGMTGVTVESIDEKIYTGLQIKPTGTDVVVKNSSGNVLNQGADASNTTADYYLTYGTNKDVSTGGTVIVNGINKYSGSITTSFDIKEHTIEENDVIIDPASNTTYTGSQIEPAVTVTVNSTPLVINKDYTLTYTNNTNIGTDTAGIKVVGIGNYAGTIEKTFSITTKTFDATIGAITDQTYTGSQITPLPVVTIGSDTLTKDVDYTVDYETNLNVGEDGGTVKVTGKGAYAGTTISKDFDIVAKSITGAMVTGLDASYVYTGSAVDDMTVTVDGIELAKDTDYTITYANTNTSANDNIKVGDVTATITGTGNYTGEITKTFKIVGRDLSTFAITDIGDQEYKHGTAIDPTVTIDGLTKDTHFTVSYNNNINVGTAYAIATGINTYSGSISEDFDITKFAITDSHVTLSSTSETYTGSPINPSVEVKISDGVVLTENTDYTLAYSNNTNVSTGVANVKVVGIGNYDGSSTKYFEIKAKDLTSESATITPIGDQTYTGSQITPDVEVKIGENILVKDVDYTVAYGTSNTNVGTGTVTVTGKGIYSGDLANATFNIVQASLNDAVVSALVDKEYNDSDKNQSFTVTVGGRTLTENTDYTVGYTYPATGVGEVTVTIAHTTSLVAGDGLGNYKDTIIRTFNINTLDISDATVNASIGTIDAKTYTGLAIEPALTIGSKDDILTSSDYDVTWANNTNAGTATATITGKGIYSGSVSKDFTINKANVSTATISGVTASKTYTGEAITQDDIVVKVTFDTIERTLEKGTDYTVSYDNNVSVGTSTVTITGIGNNYEGTNSDTTFSIIEQTLASVNAEITAITPQDYTGSQITPTIEVKLDNGNGATLRKDIDYTVSYGENINAGTTGGSVVVTGIGIYSGTLDTENFTITPITIALANIADQTYTGDPLTPPVVVTAVVNGFTQTLVEGTHYTVDYTSNTAISTNTATATITVIDSNYAVATGGTSKTFNIVATNINDGTVIIDPINDKNFTGFSIQPTGSDVVVRSFDGTVLTQGADASDTSADYYLTYGTNKDVGVDTGSVIVTGINAYTGTYTTTFNINRTNLSDSTITIMPLDNKTYTGSAIEPTVTIQTDLGTTLVGGLETNKDDTDKDYYLTFGTNTDAGTGTVNIIGINNYSGALTKSFTIEKVNLTTDGNMASTSSQDYTGSEIKPTPAVTASVGTNSAKPLTEGVDFNFTYSDNINIGTGSINAVALATSNFSGAVSDTFTIGSVAIADLDAIPDQDYTGSEIKPAITVLDGGGNTLTEGTDYTLTYSNNTNAGEATVTVTGKGNYIGSSKSTTFDIYVNLADSNIVIIDTIADQNYTGSPLTTTPIVKLANGTTIDSANYSVDHANNTNVGTGTATITAANSTYYKGSQGKDFNIKAVDISTLTIDKSAIDDVAYTGLSHSPTVTITDLTQNQDYTVTYSNNTNIGQATVTIQGINNYTGTVVETFNIGKIALTSAVITQTSSLTPSYTGEELEPTLTVKLGSDYLFKDVDYTVVYSDNIDAGTNTAKATITGIGTYSGTATFNFTIDQADVSKIDPIPNQIYTGNAIAPVSDIVVKSTISGIDKIIGSTNYNLDYTDGTDPTNIDEGDATVTATAKTGTNYQGYASNVFKIIKPELADAISVASIPAQTYTGLAITNTTNSGLVDISEKTGYTIATSDYDITYEDNINEGTAKVIIKSTSGGKYTGNVETNFQIIKNNLSDATITINPSSYNYTTNAIELTTTGATPDLVVTYEGNDLIAGTDYSVTYSNNVNVGTATVTVTGIGKYSGTNSKNFTISGFTIDSVSVSDQTYSGSALTPNLTVKDGTTELVLNKDYTAEYSSNINVGTATVVVKGIGLYEGTDSKTETFEIEEFSVPLSAIETIGTQIYTGSPIKPSPTVKVTTSDGIERTLVAGTDSDYDITWGTNTDAGTGTSGGSVTITCKGNYSGTHTVNFDIEKATLSSAINVGTIANQTYTASQIKPDLSITANTGYTVDATNDYEIDYDTTTGTNVGTAKVTIKSKSGGRYTGDVDVYFQIVEKSITASTISIDSIDTQAYTGSALTPTLTIIDSDKPQVAGADVPLVVGTDYSVAYSNNTEVGMATVTITGMGDYSGSRTVNFSITALDISETGKTVISNIDTTYPYTASAIKPTPVVVYDSKTLVEGTDYTVTYSSNNINVNTDTPVVPVTVTITGIGKYSGTLTKDFTITSVNLTSILAMDNEVYTGSTTNLIKPEPVVTAVVDGVTKILTKTTDYELSYPDTATGAYINEGSHTVKATGKGNYAGSVEQSFIIVQTDISDIIKVDPIPNQVRTGDDIEPTLVVKLASNNTELNLSTDDGLTGDYIVTYSNNTDLGTAKATITPTTSGALKDYKNTFDVYFEIVVRSITDQLITVTNNINSSGALDYTGSELTPTSIVLTDTSKIVAYTLQKDTDYTLSYSNNKDVGTASITITGIGNYSGTLVENFVIGALDISSYTVTGLEASYNYTGSAIEPTFTLDDTAGYTLVKDVDYTVSFGNNTESSAKSGASATITITGIGKYTGTITGKTFNISQATISRVNPVEDQAYTGDEVKPAVTVYADVNGVEKVLTASDYVAAYSNHINPSTASTSAKISVASASTVDNPTNYTGSAIETYFRIIQTALTDVITVDTIPNQVYTSAVASTTGITLNSTDLVVKLDGVEVPIGNNIDGYNYTVSYLNNTSEGTATVIIEAKAGGALELYSGTHSETFRIVRNDIADATITIDPTSYNATGTAIELDSAQLVVEYGGVALTKGTHYSVTYSNNTNSGNATVTITGIGDYAGSVNKNFTINGLTINTIDAIPNQTYTGEPITPSIVVKDGTTVLVKDLDYTVGYSSNNIDVTTDSGGTTTPVTVTATGIGKYAGSTQTQTFLIDPVTILSSGIEAIPDQTYTKSAIEPDIKVTAVLNMQEVVLTKDTDYTISYTGIDNINAGTGVTPIITGIGNYDGTPTASFNIVKTAINDSSITISPDPIQDQTYTQSAITIDDLKLVSNVNGTLVEADNADYDNNDYTITYEENINMGTAKITISATADSLYSGSKVLYFNIVQKSVADLVIDPIANQTFTGSALSPTLTIKDGTTPLVVDIDYTASYVDNINAGTATVLITGIGKYGGATTQNFIIDPIDISDTNTLATVSVSNETYTGTDVLPTIVVTSKAGVTLIKDEDYTVGYNNNIETGTASITISGINNYTGIIDKDFTIGQAEITSIDPIADKLYTGSAITIPDQEIIVRSTVGGASQILVNGRDYTINQDITTLVGLATISVNGTGNYTDPASGAVSQTFNIKQYTLADVTISPIPDQPYSNGSQVTPPDSDIVVRATDGTLLTKGTSDASDTGDYIIEYGTNTSLGSNAGSITIKPSTNSLYAGSQTVNFNIIQTDISNELFATVTPSIANQTYNGGTAIEPAVSVTLLSSGATLTKSTNGTSGDYTVAYSNNINKGTGTVTITGINDYTGTVTRTFTIDPANLVTTGYYVDSIINQAYTGNAISPTVTVKNSSNNRLILNTDYTVGYTNNIESGLATVNITGDGNYTGTLTQGFTIEQATVIRVEAIENQAYTGSAIIPEVIVVALVNGVEVVLTKDVHYTATYSNNINETTSSSKAKVAVKTILGGNYTGDHDVYFEIVKMSVNDASISLTPSPIPDKYYTGSDIIIDDLSLKSIVDGLETTLVQSTDGGTTGDYKVTYSNNKEVGTATILIEGINFYTGSRSITFNIGKVSITDPTITIDSISNQVYTGSAIEPTLNINHIVDGVPIPLVKDQDYTVVFNSNTEVGTATAVITGIGKYTGSVSKTFTIESFNIGTSIISPIADQIYTSESITPLLEVKITVDGTEYTLVKDIDYTVGFTNNVQVGTSIVTISGIGKYSGTNSTTFNITPITIQEDGITPNPIPDQAYAGMAEVKPELLVKTTVNGFEKILTENLDYILNYWNNQDMGTASVRVSGINNFTNPKDLAGDSELVFDFEILKTDLADTSLVIVDDIPNQIYKGDGVAITPTLTVTLSDGTPLVLGSDYTVSYSNNIGVGTATATITAVTGSYYTGSRDIDFEIVKSSIADATFATITPNTLSDSIYIGTNVNYDSQIAITLINGGATLVKDQDYTISYTDNVNAGLVTVTISGIGLYSGTITKTFTINPIVLTTGLIDPIPDQPYTGTFITLNSPDLTINQVQVNGSNVTLVKDQDYTLEYSSNIEPGTAVLTLAGIGNYTGVLKETFLINKYDVSAFEQIKINITEPTYTGSEILLDSSQLEIIHEGGGAGGSDYTLVENTDFTVNYNTEHTDAGIVSITITGMGIYTGSTIKYFNILPRDIDLATTTPSSFPDQTYTSLAITPDVTGVNLIDLDGINFTDLVLGQDYEVSYTNNTNIGTASIILTGKGNYTGTAVFNFEITQISLLSSDIEVSGLESYTTTYDGTEKEPDVSNALRDSKGSVDDVSGFDLVKDVDFTVTYSNNINAGTATVTFNGIGTYQGERTITFEILQKSLTGADIIGLKESYTYTGSEITPSPKVVVDSIELIKDIDYNISYGNNIDISTSFEIGDGATLEIVGIDNYAGTINKEFFIEEDFSDLDFDFDFDFSSISNYEYTNSENEFESLEEDLELDNPTSNINDILEDETSIELVEQEDIQVTQVQQANTSNTSASLSNVLSNFLSNNLSNISFSKNTNTESKNIFTILSNLFKK